MRRRAPVLSGVAASAEDPDRAPVRWIARALLYFVSGLAFGFLFLAEFAFSTIAPVQVAIVLLAFTSVVGGLRGRPNLSVWSILVFGALLFPLLIDARSALLPLCADIPLGVACIARDYRGQFVVELASFVASCIGALLYLRLGLKRGEC